MHSNGEIGPADSLSGDRSMAADSTAVLHVSMKYSDVMVDTKSNGRPFVMMIDQICRLSRRFDFVSKKY